MWFFAYSARGETLLACGVIIFAAVLCFYSIYVTNSFRIAFNLYIDRINSFDREYAVTIRPAPGEPIKVSTLGAFVRVLWVAFAFSIAGAIYLVVPAVRKLLQ